METHEPACADDGVVVEVHYCGICGSDLELFNRGAAGVDPAHASYQGHEFSGVVVAVGEQVTDLVVGDRVTTGVVQGCGVCGPCRRGRPNFCRGLSEVLSPGGFAQRTSVRHGDHHYLVPCGDMDLELAALHEPLSCSLRIVEQSRVSAGQLVVVLGLGPIGIMSALLATAFGASTVIGIDANEARVKAANGLGIDAVQLDDGRLDTTGLPEADVVIEATGAPEALSLAVALAGLGGRVVIGSVYGRRASDVDLRPIMRKELTIIGAKGPFPHLTRSGTSAALQLLQRPDLPWTSLIQSFEISDAETAFLLMSQRQVIKPVIAMQAAHRG